MQDGVYSALFGALSAEHQLNIITNNLANTNTVGFKRDAATFADVFRRQASDKLPDTRQALGDQSAWAAPVVLAKPRLSGRTTDMSQGALQYTGNPLDIALQGEGFFKIMTPGGMRYTRGGNFLRNLEGEVVDSHGNQLQGDSGPISLGSAKTIEIDSRGNVFANSERIGTVAVVRFANPGDLEKEGHNLFKLKDGVSGGEQPVSTGEMLNTEGGEMAATVNQGYLESPNVEVVTEMVRMIEVQRSFEAYNKVMQGSQDIDRRLFSAMGKSV